MRRILNTSVGENINILNKGINNSSGLLCLINLLVKIYNQM